MSKTIHLHDYIAPYRIGAKELVDKETYELLGPINSYRLFDIRLLITLQQIKQHTGWIIVINTWSFSPGAQKRYGLFSNRGFRKQSSSTGTKTGAHYYGGAVDFDVYDKKGNRISPDEVRQFILDNIDKFPHIKFMEIDINWVHIDVWGEDECSKRCGINEKTVFLWSPKNKENNKIIRRKAA